MIRHQERYDIQGRFLGIPYDFRVPSLAKIVHRMYLPDGPAFPPKVFGIGWGLNYANPRAQWIFAALMGFLAGAALYG